MGGQPRGKTMSRMDRKRLGVFLAVCISALQPISVSRASGERNAQKVVYSDLNHKKQADCYVRSVWTEDGSQVEGGSEAVAFGFKPKKSYLATSIKLPLTYTAKYGAGHSFDVLIVNNQVISGTWIKSLGPMNVYEKGSVLARQTTNVANPYGQCTLQTVQFSPGAQLAGGQIYWVVILASPDTFGGWTNSYSQSVPLGYMDTSENGGRNWDDVQFANYPGAFAVYGTPAGN
jgi:hypothetical protein